MALAVQDVGGLQAALLGHGTELGEQHSGADAALLVEQPRVALDGVGDIADVAEQAGFMFLDIDLRHTDRIAERVLDGTGEDSVQAQIQCHRREDGDQDGGHHRDGGEPGHQPHMQPGAGASRAPRLPRPRQAPADQRRQRQDQRQVDQQQGDQPGAIWRVGHQAGQQRIGHAARNHRQDCDAEGQL